jgi:hypothetical protein
MDFPRRLLPFRARRCGNWKRNWKYCDIRHGSDRVRLRKAKRVQCLYVGSCSTWFQISRLPNPSCVTVMVNPLKYRPFSNEVCCDIAGRNQTEKTIAVIVFLLFIAFSIYNVSLDIIDGNVSLFIIAELTIFSIILRKSYLPSIRLSKTRTDAVVLLSLNFCPVIVFWAAISAVWVFVDVAVFSSFVNTGILGAIVDVVIPVVFYCDLYCSAIRIGSLQVSGSR